MYMLSNNSGGFFQEVTPPRWAFEPLDDSQQNENSFSGIDIPQYPKPNFIPNGGNSKDISKEPNSSETLMEQSNQDEKKRKNKPNYQKNILTNIMKTTTQSLSGKQYQKVVRLLCKKYDFDYDEIVAYYKPKNAKETYSISRVRQMLFIRNQSQKGLKLILKEFMTWFLRNGYMKYLMTEGKMKEKQIYIRQKNVILWKIDAMSKGTFTQDILQDFTKVKA